MEKIRVDIIIPVYYGLGLTSRSVYSVLKNCSFKKYDLKLIVVDDSGDHVFSKLLSSQIEELDAEGKVHIITHQINKGFIEACYSGIEYRDSDYKLLLNSDTYILPDSLEEMIAVAEGDERIAIVNPVTNQISVINAEMPEGFNIWDMHRTVGNFPSSQDDYIDIVTSVGFCMLIKSEHIDKHGFFDRIFGYGYGEDTDLHFRYVDNGLRAVIATRSFVYHRGEGSFSDRDEKVLFARKVVFDRYQSLYDRTFPEFAQKTVVNKLRSYVDGTKEYTSKVLFLTETNSMSDPEHRYAHTLANSLLEQGTSANIAYREEVSNPSFADDRLYTPTRISALDQMLMPVELIVVTDHSLYASAIEYSSMLYKETGEFPKIAFGSSSADKIRNVIDDKKSLYDIYICAENQDQSNCSQPLFTPEVADILSNIGLNKTANPEEIFVMFSSSADSEDMTNLARHASNIGGQVTFYKFGDKSERMKVGSHEVRIIEWAETEELYSLLKKTSVYISMSDQIFTNEVLLCAYAGINILLNSSLEDKDEKLPDILKVDYIEVDDYIKVAEQLEVTLASKPDFRLMGGLYNAFSSYKQKETILRIIDSALNTRKHDQESFAARISEYVDVKSHLASDRISEEENTKFDAPKTVSNSSKVAQRIRPYLKKSIAPFRSKLK